MACWCTFQKIIIAYGSVTCTYAVLAYIQYLVMDNCSRRSVVKYVYLFLKSIYLKLLVFMGVMILGFTQLTSCMFFLIALLTNWTYFLLFFSTNPCLTVFCFWASFFCLVFQTDGEFAEEGRAFRSSAEWYGVAVDHRNVKFYVVFLVGS